MRETVYFKRFYSGAAKAVLVAYHVDDPNMGKDGPITCVPTCMTQVHIGMLFQYACDERLHHEEPRCAREGKAQRGRRATR